MGRQITTGAYWFYRGQFDRAGMDLQVTLRDKAEGEVLQKAALRVMKRYPFLRFGCEKSEDGCQFVLVERERPFSAVENDGFVSLEHPAVAGFLWSLGYSENKLYLRMFHGLTDGLGMVSVMKSLLCAYFSALSGEPLGPQLRELVEAEPDGREYADPFDFARPCDRSYSFRVPKAVLLKREIEEWDAPLSVRILLSLREVLSVSKQTEGSVSGILSLLMARALDRMNDDPSRSIVVNCPMNLRPLLGCGETMQNCVSAVKYVYSEKLKKMPFPRQASCFKGMLMIQASEEHQMNKFFAWKQEILQFNREGSIEEKRAMLKAGEDCFPMVSYLGGFSAGDYDPLIRDVDVSMNLGSGIGMVALSLGDRLSVKLLLSEKNRSFVRLLTDELDALGIAYTFV